MRFHCLIHSDLGGDIHLPHWAASRGHDWTLVPVHRSAPPPEPQAQNALAILGGPMSVWEEGRHPWLKAEKRLIEDFLRAGQPVLGICLGAQLLAEVLGARVYPGAQREIGWLPVRRVPEAAAHALGAQLPEHFHTFLWHGDTFDLPSGAAHLARSEAVPHQAFACGSALALQFHLEARTDWVRRLVERDAAQMTPERHVQSAETVLTRSNRFYPENNALLDRLLDRWLETTVPA